MTDDPKKLNDPKTFSFTNYADEFDTHISQSIRGYSDLRDDVIGISKYFVVPNTQVLDIGCSEGTLIEKIAENNMHQIPVHFIGCEINPAFTKGWSKRGYMQGRYSKRMVYDDEKEEMVSWPEPDSEYPKKWLKHLTLDDPTSLITFVNTDILEWLNSPVHQHKRISTLPENPHFIKSDEPSFSFVVSLFTMQFLPERGRLPLFKKIYDNLTDGGAFLTSEKIFAQNAKVQDMLDSLYYEFKTKSFSEKEILDKEKELRHLAKLTTENLLISQLRSVGFRGIQIFWRNFNFIGVLAMKRPPEEVEGE